MVLKRQIVLFAFGAIVATSCGGGGQQQAETVAEKPGQGVYERNCSACHGKDGKLELAGASNLATSTLSAEERHEVILNGRGTMAAWGGVLSEQEVLDLVDYVETLRN